MWLAAVLIIISVYLYLDTRKPKNFPPGPEWLPIIGSALAANKYRQKKKTVCLATAEMSKDYSGGKLVGLKIGNELQVIVTSIDGCKEVATNHQLDGRPTGLMFTEKSWGLRRGIIFTDGEFWQEQNNFLVQHLRGHGFGKSSDENSITIEVTRLINHFKTVIKKSTNGVGTVEMHRVFDIPIMNNIMLFLAGERYDLDDLRIKKLQHEFTDVFNSASMMGCIFHYFPILKYIAPDASGYSLYMRVNNKGNEFMQELINQHKETYKAGVVRDFMDAYIKELLSRGEDGSSFSEKQLISTCLDLFIAGSDTTSKALSFGFLHFLRHPEVVKRAQEEMDRVVGRKRLPTLDDRPCLPYTEACVYETIRIFTGVALTVPRRALEDTTLLGYFIPKGANVVVNASGIHMNEHIWKDPWTFKPERFLDVNGKFLLPNNGFYPFGLGSRRCLGENSAKPSVFLFISHIFHTFNIKNPEGSLLPDPFPMEGVIPSTQPYEAEISLR